MEIIDTFACSEIDIFGIVFVDRISKYQRLMTILIMNHMKIVVYFVISLLAISCLKKGENGYYIRTTGRVEIKQAVIPDTVTDNQYAEIMAWAEASNGCWSNLNFVLTKTADFEYSLEAFGIFESTGYCEDIKVLGDSTIVFKPTVTGKYIFKVTKAKLKLKQIR